MIDNITNNDIHEKKFKHSNFYNGRKFTKYRQAAVWFYIFLTFFAFNQEEWIVFFNRCNVEQVCVPEFFLDGWCIVKEHLYTIKYLVTIFTYF